MIEGIKVREPLLTKRRLGLRRYQAIVGRQGLKPSAHPIKSLWSLSRDIRDGP
jgi:hypothetical protein